MENVEAYCAASAARLLDAEIALILQRHTAQGPSSPYFKAVIEEAARRRLVQPGEN